MKSKWDQSKNPTQVNEYNFITIKAYFVTTLYCLDESDKGIRGQDFYMIVGRSHIGGRMIILKLMFEKR